MRISIQKTRALEQLDCYLQMKHFFAIKYKALHTPTSFHHELNKYLEYDQSVVLYLHIEKGNKGVNELPGSCGSVFPIHRNIHIILCYNDLW